MLSKEWDIILPEIKRWIREKKSNYYKISMKYMMCVPFYAKKTYQEFSIFRDDALLVTLYRKEQSDIRIKTKYINIGDDLYKWFNRIKKSKLE